MGNLGACERAQTKSRRAGNFVWMKACVYIYMFICTEFIEETGRPPGLFFGMWGYFWPGSHRFESWKKIYTFAVFIK